MSNISKFKKLIANENKDVSPILNECGLEGVFEIAEDILSCNAWISEVLNDNDVDEDEHVECLAHNIISGRTNFV